MTRRRLLAAHFRRRMLEPEHATSDGGATLFHLMALLAAPAVITPFVLLIKNLRVSLFNFQRAELARIASGDRFFFVVLSMTVTGLVTLVLWDALFPDRKDYLNLAPLPIPSREIFLAKLAALLEVVGGFFLVATGIPAIVAPLFWVDHAGGGTPFRPILAFLAATLAASGFVFFSLAGLQGLLQSLLPPAAFRRLSAMLQAVALATILLVFFLRTSAEEAWLALRAGEPGAAASLPPLWFAGLHERLLGVPGAPHGMLSLRALAAAGAAALLFFAAYTLSYRRFLSGALDAPHVAPHARGRELLVRVLERTFRDGAAAGMLRFALRTLGRGARHRLVVAAGAALAFALSVSAGIALRPPGAFPDEELLALPLVQTFCLAVAARVALGTPVELPASWLFRLMPVPDGDRYFAGARRAAAVIAVAPPALLALAVSFPLFGAPVAALQALFDVAAGLLLVDGVFAGMRRVPLVTAPVPGESRIHATAFLWFLAFFAYGKLGATLERALLERPAALVVAAAAALAARALLGRRRARVRRAFEAPVDGMVSLGLRPET